jgi:hypothetical protein
MTVDPDSINERSRTVSANDLKMIDHPEQSSEDTEEMGSMADIDPKLREQFDL